MNLPVGEIDLAETSTNSSQQSAEIKELDSDWSGIFLEVWQLRYI